MNLKSACRSLKNRCHCDLIFEEQKKARGGRQWPKLPCCGTSTLSTSTWSTEPLFFGGNKNRAGLSDNRNHLNPGRWVRPLCENGCFRSLKHTERSSSSPNTSSPDTDNKDGEFSQRLSTQTHVAMPFCEICAIPNCFWAGCAIRALDVVWMAWSIWEWMLMYLYFLLGFVDQEKKKWRPQQEGSWPCNLYALLQLQSLRWKGQGYQAFHSEEHGRECRRSWYQRS